MLQPETFPRRLPGSRMTNLPLLSETGFQRNPPLPPPLELLEEEEEEDEELLAAVACSCKPANLSWTTWSSSGEMAPELVVRSQPVKLKTMKKETKVRNRQLATFVIRFCLLLRRCR